MLEWPYYQKPNRGIVLPPIPYTKRRWSISSSGWGDAGCKKFLRFTISETDKHILHLLSTWPNSDISVVYGVDVLDIDYLFDAETH